MSPLPGFAAEAALNAAHGDVARAGVQIDVARAGFIDFEVAAAGAASAPRPRNFAGADVAGSGLQPNLAGQARQLHIARAGLHVDIAAACLR